MIKRVAGCCLTSALLASIAAEPASAEQRQMETVTVTARVPRELSEVAATVSIIDQDELEALLPRDVADLARYQPGLTVRNDATRFGAGSIALRGIGGNRVLIETDGVPSSPAFSIGNFADAPRAYADLDLVRRIEILRGPASSLYGSDAIGGVVSVATLDPIDLLREEQAALRVRAQGTSDDDGSLAGVLGAARLGPLETLIGWAHREADALQIESDAFEANPQESRRDSLHARAVYDGFRAPVRATVAHQSSRTETDVRSLRLLAGTRFANTLAMRGDDRFTVTTLLIDQTLLDVGPLAQLDWRVYWREARTEQRTFEERRAAPPRTPAVALERAFELTDRTVGAELTASRDFALAGFTHRLVAGLEASHSRVAELRKGRQVTLATGASTDVILGEAFPLRDFPLSELVAAGAYVQDELRRDGGRWRLIPALRVDYSELEPHADQIYVADNPHVPPVSSSELALSPRIGLTYLATPQVTAFVQYAHGFRAPPFEDVNIGFDLPQLNYRAIPNPGLKPERSDSVEIGMRRSGDGFTAAASAYYSRYRDFIESRVNLGPDASGVTLFQSRNLAQARIYGAELEAKVDLEAAHAALAGFSARLAGHWARGDDTALDRPLNAIDPAKAIVGLDFAARSGRWGVGGTTVLVAAKSRIDEAATPLARAPGFATLDLDGWYRPSASVTVRASLRNALDRSYFEWADIRGRAADDPLLELYRRPGRSAALSVTLDLR